MNRTSASNSVFSKISFGLRERIAIVLTLLIIFIMLISVFLVTVQIKNTSMSRAVETGRMIGKMVALTMGEDLVRGNFRGIDYALNELVKINKIKYCIILDNLGKIISSSNRSLNGKYFFDAWSRSAVYSEKISIRRASLNGMPIYDIAIPIVVAGNKYGLIRVGITLEDEYKSIRKILIYNLSLGVILILLGLFIAYGLSATVLAPVSNILNIIEALSKKELSYKELIAKKDEYSSTVKSLLKITSIFADEPANLSANSKSFWKKVSNLDYNYYSGKSVQAAVLCVSMRNFDSFVDLYSPSEVIDTLNGFYDKVCSLIKKSGGVTDNVFDGKIFAVFPVVKDSRWPAELRAVYAALQIKAELSGFNFNQAKLGLEELKISCSAAFGNIVVGDIGPYGRQEFSCIGKTLRRAIVMTEYSSSENSYAPVIDKNIYTSARSFLKTKKIKANNDIKTIEESDFYSVIGFANTSYYYERLETSQDKDIKRFIKIFGLTANNEGFEFLKKIVTDENSQYKMEALKAMQPFIITDFTKVVDFLKQLVKDCEDINLRAVAVGLLALKRDISLLSFFKELLNDKDDRVRANALEACIPLNSHNRKQIFKNLIDDLSPRVCANALLGLWITDDHETLSNIYSLLKSDNSKMRASAAYAVSFLASSRKFRRLFPAYKEEEKFLLLPVIENILKRLSLMLDSTDTTERKQALRALGKIGGKELIERLEALLEVENEPEIIQEIKLILAKFKENH